MAFALSIGQALLPGEQLFSRSSNFRLIYQTDNNLVLYQGTKALWHTHTYGQAPGRFVLEERGMAIYNAANQVSWSLDLGYALAAGSRLEPTNAGDLVIVEPQGQMRFSRFALNAPAFSFWNIADGSALAVQDDGGAISFTKSYDCASTLFALQPIAEHEFRVFTIQGGFLMADGGGGGNLWSSSRNAGDWERFTLVPVGDCFAALKSFNKRSFVSTNRSYNGSLATCRANEIGSWETFQITCRNLAAIRKVQAWNIGARAYGVLRGAADSRYVSRRDDASDVLVLRSAGAPSSLEGIELQLLPNMQCRFKSPKGWLWQANGETLRACSANPGAWETFSLEWLGDELAIKAQNGKYLTIKDGILAAAGADNGFRFQFEPTSPAIVLNEAVRSFPPDTVNQLTALHSHKAMTLPSLSPGANVQQWPADGRENQLFILNPTGDGYTTLCSAQTGLAVEVAGAGTANGSGLALAPFNGGEHQQFLPVQLYTGAYRFVARHSGQVIDVSGISTADGAPLHAWDYVGGGNQEFLVKSYPRGRTVVLQRIVCYQADETGGDNIYLKVNGKKIWACQGTMIPIEQAMDQIKLLSSYATFSKTGWLTGARDEIYRRYIGLNTPACQSLGDMTFQNVSADRPLKVEIWDEDDFLRGDDDLYGTITITADMHGMDPPLAGGEVLVKDCSPAIFNLGEIMTWASGGLQATYMIVYQIL